MKNQNDPTAESFIGNQAELPSTENQGWENVSANIEVWKVEEQPELICYNKGTGKTLGEGAKSTKTYLVQDMSGQEWYIPQWKSVEALGTDTELGANIYRLRYKGKKALEGGTSYHVVDVAKKKATTPLDLNGK